MKRLMTTFLLIWGILTISSNATAMTVVEYQESKDNKKTWPVTLIYLNGVGVGASLAASLLLQQGGSSVFCQPTEITLKKEDYIRLIDAFIAKNDVKDAPVESILFFALVTAFPCK
jgi:hypothetical protein